MVLGSFLDGLGDSSSVCPVHSLVGLLSMEFEERAESRVGPDLALSEARGWNHRARSFSKCSCVQFLYSYEL